MTKYVNKKYYQSYFLMSERKNKSIFPLNEFRIRFK